MLEAADILSHEEPVPCVCIFLEPTKSTWQLAIQNSSATDLALRRNLEAEKTLAVVGRYEEFSKLRIARQFVGSLFCCRFSPHLLKRAPRYC